MAVASWLFAPYSQMKLIHPQTTDSHYCPLQVSIPRSETSHLYSREIASYTYLAWCQVPLLFPEWRYLQS